MDTHSFCGNSTRSVSFSDIDQSNEMLNAENVNLRERVYELERKLDSQEDELVCLRSLTADLLRRITLLEQKSSSAIQSQTNNNLNSSQNVFVRLSRPTLLGDRPRVAPTNRNISQSNNNLRSISNPSPHVLTNGHRSSPPTSIRRVSIESGDSSGIDHDSQPHRMPRQNMVNGGLKGNLPAKIGQKDQNSQNNRMRKWMSTADVKENNKNSTQISGAVNNNELSSPLYSTPNSLRHAKSTARFGSLSSLAASHRSISQLGFNIRDPVYLSEQRNLQVFVRGKSVMLATPSSVTTLDPLREIDPPKINARLEWIYGYRGKDSRSNLHELPTGEMVYFVGAVVILHNPEERTQRHYTHHTSEIKCIAIHPNRLYIATGQTSRHSPEKKILNEHRSPICSPEDLDNVLESDQTQAHIRVWDSVTLQTLYCLGLSDASFERGVSCVAFSKQDGGYFIAAIDDSYEHTLSIWDWQKRKKLTETKSANDQAFLCEFHPQVKNMIVCFGKGHFNVWCFDGMTLTKKPLVFEGRDKPKLVLSICFLEPGYIVSGDSNGTISLWDSKSLKVVRQASKVHEGGVWALCAMNGGKILSGGKDGMLIEWNGQDLSRIRSTNLSDDAGIIRTLAPARYSTVLIGTTKNAILYGDPRSGFRYLLQAHSEELWALAPHPCMSQYLTGSIDGVIRFWDSQTKTILWTVFNQDGVVCADFHPSGNVFAIGTVTGSWIVYDVGTREPISTINEGSQPISAMRFSPDGNAIAVGTKEPRFFLYSISPDRRQFNRTVNFTGVPSYITAIDWSCDNILMRTNNNDLEQQIWHISSGRITEMGKWRDTKWASSRCIVSFENGCIAQSVPGIMAVERSPDSRFTAVAIDNGAIRFYQHPATSVMAMHKEIFGHSTFIGNISFLKSRLISVGAKDTAIFQWRL